MHHLDQTPIWPEIANVAGHVILMGAAFWALWVCVRQWQRTDDDSERKKQGCLLVAFALVSLSLSAEVILLLTTGEGVVERLHSLWR